MSKANMDWMDAEELAAAVLGIGENYDSEQIEDAIFEKFDVSFDQFHKIAEALICFTPTVTTALGGEICHGFVKDGVLIAKMTTGA